MILEIYAEVYSDQFTTGKSPFHTATAVQYSAKQKTANNYVNQNDTLP